MDNSPLRNIFFAAAVIVAVLGTAELLSRVLFPKTVIEDVVPKSLIQSHNRYGWSLRPDTTAVSRRLGYPVQYDINSNGLRDAHTSYEKSPGIVRILLLGGSEVFGYGVPIEKHFSKILEGYRKNFEVINMGVPDFGVDQQLLALQNEGYKYDPDIVIAHAFDYSGEAHMYTRRLGREKPCFVFREGKFQLENYPVVDVDASWEVQPSVSSEFGIVTEWLYANSRLYQIFYDQIVSIFKEDDSGGEPVAEAESPYSKKDEDYREKVYALGQRIIFEMDREAKHMGSRFILVTAMDKMHRSAVNLGIESIYLKGALDNTSLELPEGLGHLNEAGNGVVALSIHQYLAGQKPFSPDL